MKIKNTRELVLRARGHARKDHIIQGTYGDASTNGHATFKGCAIGCLATPHRQRELDSWVRRFLDGFYQDDEYEMVDRLGDEFGICPELARIAESVFENLITHGAAIEFIPQFAAALPEGVDIQARQVKTFWERTTGYGVDSEGALPPDDAQQARDLLLAWLRERGAKAVAV